MSQEELLIPKGHIDRVTMKHVEQLSSLLRYRRFMEGETLQDWVDLLGPDVVGFTHPDVTAAITHSFVEYNSDHGLKLLPEERGLLLTTPWVHDWGELIIEGTGIGDVTFEQKTTTAEHVEYQVFDLVMEDIEKGSAKEWLQRAYYEVAMKRDTKLGRMFNAVERLGYLLTAKRAFEGINRTRIRNWRGLVGNVLSNQIEKLLEYRREYPYVHYILQSSSEIITRMFDDVLAEGVLLDGEGNPSYDLQKLRKVRLAWEATS